MSVCEENKVAKYNSDTTDCNCKHISQVLQSVVTDYHLVRHVLPPIRDVLLSVSHVMQSIFTLLQYCFNNAD